MIRILLAAVLGGLVYHVWVFLSWVPFELHDSTLTALPDGPAVAESLKAQDIESGVYVYPWHKDHSGKKISEDEFKKRHQEGPLFMLYYTKEGTEAMPMSMMLGGAGLNIISAGLAACLLSCAGGCCRHYLCRVGFVLGLGLFVFVVGHGAYWNWMRFPTDYTLRFAIDLAVGWTLAGLVIAALIRPTPAKD